VESLNGNHCDSQSVVIARRPAADLWNNRSGGIQQGSAFQDNLDVVLDLDGESLWSLRDTRLLFNGLCNNGTSFSESIVGDVQVLSSIETGVQAIRLYAAWVDFRLADKIQMLFGVYDLIGVADGDFNLFSEFVCTGLHWRGLIIRARR
jgi:carbohydrate-selective porin OprB